MGGSLWYYGFVSFASTVTGEGYAEMLQNYFQPAVVDWPNLNDVGCQHKGSPAHYDHITGEYLDETFPRRWMSRRGRIDWISRLPDLSSVKCFCVECSKGCGLLKETSLRRLTSYKMRFLIDFNRFQLTYVKKSVGL